MRNDNYAVLVRGAKKAAYAADFLKWYIIIRIKYKT